MTQIDKTSHAPPILKFRVIIKIRVSFRVWVRIMVRVKDGVCVGTVFSVIVWFSLSI